MVGIVDRSKVIARGTPGQLRARARDAWNWPARPARTPAAWPPRWLPSAVASRRSIRGRGRVVLPVADGAGILPEVAGRLAAAGLAVSGLALRRPTLEEAFLALTGQPAASRAGTGPDGGSELAAARRARSSGSSR